MEKFSLKKQFRNFRKANWKCQLLHQIQNTENFQLTLIGLGFFLTPLGLGMPAPLIIFVVCGPIATKFCTGIDNQSISSNMEKICIKLMMSLK